MDQLSPTEWLARYILTKKWYSRSKNLVKYNAFLPLRNSETLVLETSVYRIASLQEEEIWKIGEREVAQKRDRHLHGRADIVLSIVLNKGLNVNPDNTPPRHGNIVGWPEEKSEQMSVAVEFAANSYLRLK